MISSLLVRQLLTKAAHFLEQREIEDVRYEICARI